MTEPDHADVRMPPPLIYVGVLALAFLAHRLWPLAPLPEVTARVGGLVFIVVGLVLSIWSVVLFRRARTSVIPVRPTTALVADGPYRFTRNPMYLGLLSLYLGAALLMNLPWGVLLSPAVVLFVRRFAIDEEEQYLERKFRSEFASYKTRVRRWL